MRHKCGLLVAAMLLLSGSAHAGTQCTVATAGVAFGQYAPLNNTISDVTGTVTVTCTGQISDSVSYTLSVSAGGGTFANRRMTAGANTLRYNLYTDSARTRLWGDGNGNGTFTIDDSYTFGSGTVVRTYTVFGRIPNAQTTTKTGSYAENLVATVKW